MNESVVVYIDNRVDIRGDASHARAIGTGAQKESHQKRKERHSNNNGNILPQTNDIGVKCRDGRDAGNHNVVHHEARRRFAARPSPTTQPEAYAVFQENTGIIVRFEENGTRTGNLQAVIARFDDTWGHGHRGDVAFIRGQQGRDIAQTNRRSIHLRLNGKNGLVFRRAVIVDVKVDETLGRCDIFTAHGQRCEITIRPKRRTHGRQEDEVSNQQVFHSRPQWKGEQPKKKGNSIPSPPILVCKCKTIILDYCDSTNTHPMDRHLLLQATSLPKAIYVLFFIAYAMLLVAYATAWFMIGRIFQSSNMATEFNFLDIAMLTFLMSSINAVGCLAIWIFYRLSSCSTRSKNRDMDDDEII